MIRATSFQGKTVAVFGLGSSGTAAARALLAGGANVAAWDDSAAGREAAVRDGIPLVDLAAADWSGFSALVLAPGVPLTHPEPHWTVVKARQSGVEIIGDIEVFARERALRAPKAPFIAITGTNGKSTTTALVAHILRHAGYDVQLGGNIGRAILTLEEPAPDRFHVVEMSSFQIDLTPTLNPTVGVMLNVTPDHLDRHGTIENYAAVKERVVQGAEVAAIGIDDDFGLAMLKRRIESGPAVAFSAEKSLAPGYSLLDDTIICSNRAALAVKLGSLSGITTLRGRHNAQNALGADRGRSRVPELARSIRRSRLARRAGVVPRPAAPDGRSRARGQRSLHQRQQSDERRIRPKRRFCRFRAMCSGSSAASPRRAASQALEPLFGGISKAYLIGESSEDFAATLEGKVAFRAERNARCCRRCSGKGRCEKSRRRAGRTACRRRARATTSSRTSRFAATLFAPLSRRCRASR